MDHIQKIAKTKKNVKKWKLNTVKERETHKHTQRVAYKRSRQIVGSRNSRSTAIMRYIQLGSNNVYDSNHYLKRENVSQHRTNNERHTAHTFVLEFECNSDCVRALAMFVCVHCEHTELLLCAFITTINWICLNCSLAKRTHNTHLTER